jgi:hypothetical protein
MPVENVVNYDLDPNTPLPSQAEVPSRVKTTSVGKRVPDN